MPSFNRPEPNRRKGDRGSCLYYLTLSRCTWLFFKLFIDSHTVLCYLAAMASLITKWNKGKPYLYWVRSARVNGHSRIVEQVYLGPRQRVMAHIRAQFTASSTSAPLPVLRAVQTREFGASALCYTLAQELGLIALINAHVPPAPPGRRTSLSVGHYLVLAARNRAIWPKSKRAFAEWYADTVLVRLLPAPSEELSSQRFWDHMDLVEDNHLAAIQRALLARLSQRFPLGERFLMYDTTNYYTFVIAQPPS